MTGVPLLRLLPSVVCDDIRREDNGKLLFVGVYPSDLLVRVFPARLRLCLALVTNASEQGDTHLELQVTDGQTRLAQGSAEININARGPGILAFPAFPIELNKPTTLLFQAREGEGQWETVRALPAKLQPV